MKQTKNRIKELYFDYVNNFITVAYFAESYELEYNKALQLINLGRQLTKK